MNRPSKKINQSGADIGLGHRADFTTCPSCDQRMTNEEWDAAATILVLEPRSPRAGAVAVVSECPKCFESSWVHFKMSGFEWYGKFPPDWIEAVEKHDEMMLAKAIIEWKNSLCRTCAHRKGKPHEYNNWRNCVDGGKGLGGPETECDKYLKK